jgi:hypothetical protein
MLSRASKNEMRGGVALVLIAENVAGRAGTASHSTELMAGKLAGATLGVINAMN